MVIETAKSSKEHGPNLIVGSLKALHIAALLFAMLFPTFMAWIYFMVLAPAARQPGLPHEEQRAGWLVTVVYGVSKGIQFGFPLVWVGLFERYRLRPSRPSFRGLLLGLAFGLIVAAGILAAYFGG